MQKLKLKASFTFAMNSSDCVLTVMPSPAGDRDPHNVGQRVILPSSFTGGPRYMFERQQDAMIYVRQFVRLIYLLS